MDVDAIERQKKLEEAMQRAQDDEEIIRLEQAELRRKQHEEAIQRQKEHAEAIQRKKEREEQRNTAIKEASCRTAEAALKGVFAHFRAERAAEKQRNREVALCLNDVLNQVMAIGLNNTSLREGADLVDVSVAEPTASWQPWQTIQQQTQRVAESFARVPPHRSRPGSRRCPRLQFQPQTLRR
jgi:hypothetical protein